MHNVLWPPMQAVPGGGLALDHADTVPPTTTEDWMN